MPGRGSYGPGGKWIHDRAHRIMEKNPDADKGMAYAIATQQGHKVGKSPKGFRTKEGVREAKQKFSGPKKEYQKTASDMERGINALLMSAPVMGAMTGAGAGALTAGKGRRGQGALRGGLAGGAAAIPAFVGAAQIPSLYGVPVLASPFAGGAVAGGLAGLTARKKREGAEKTAGRLVTASELEKAALVGLGETGNALMPQFAHQLPAGGIPASVQAAVNQAHVQLPNYAQRASVVARHAPKGGSARKAAKAGGGLLKRLFKRAEAFPGWVGPIEQETEDNTNFRKVLFTGKHSQLVLMSIPVGGEIGEETHEAVDQFFRIDGGEGAVIMNGQRRAIEDGDAFVIPAGTRHNVINTSDDEPLQLYSIYSPPNHQPGTIHKTKEDAVRAEEEGTDPKPTAASIVPGKEKLADGDEEGTPGKLVPKAVLEEFFRKNPAPPDSKVHALAEEHQANPHAVEAQIYEMLGSRMKKEGMTREEKTQRTNKGKAFGGLGGALVGGGAGALGLRAIDKSGRLAGLPIPAQMLIGGGLMGASTLAGMRGGTAIGRHLGRRSWQKEEAKEKTGSISVGSFFEELQRI
jgi:mannose-6-phosphate isomerase-like protein (cupin superfamily)